MAAEALLAALWRRRAAREPVLIVIDEAHNVCPARPEDPLTAMATEHAVRIAGEGRKFGLVLLVATQRPQKVHENVVSQCENLVLMRMNSRSDLALLAETFSFVPSSLLGLSDRVPAGRGGGGRQARPDPDPRALRTALVGRGRRRRALRLGREAVLGDLGRLARSPSDGRRRDALREEERDEVEQREDRERRARGRRSARRGRRRARRRSLVG